MARYGGSRSQQDLEFMFGAFQNLSKALEKRKQDEMANLLMNRTEPPRAAPVDQYGATYDPALAAQQGLYSPTDPGPSSPFGGGVAGWKMHDLMQKDSLDSQVKRAQLAKLLAKDDAPDTATDDLKYQILWNKAHPDEAPDDSGMTPYQREQTRLREMDINRKANAGHTFSGLDKEIEAATGYDLGTWRRAKNKRIDPRTGDFMAEIYPKNADPAVDQGQTVSVPGNLYQNFLSRVKDLEGSNTARTDQVRPQVGELPATDPTTEPDNTTPSPSITPQADKFVVGKKYKDAQGNVAVYLGNGQWQ